MIERSDDQKNWPLTSAEDFLTREYIIPLLRDPSRRKKLIEEHKNNPIGSAGRMGKPGTGHSDELCRILDKLRRAPMKGKYCKVCTKPHAEWRIGRFPGVRGEPITILNEVFSSEDACEHAIFLRRIEELLETYSSQGFT